MKRITIYSVEYWLKKGYSEDESIKMVSKVKKENSCWNKEFWVVKKGYTEEQAILKVKEVQQRNSKKQDKTNIKNVYDTQTWVDKGYTEKDAKDKVNILKNKCNIYANLSKEKIDSIKENRKNTYYSKPKEEIEKINKSRGRTTGELVEKFGEDYTNTILNNRGKGRRNSLFRRYSKISKELFDSVSSKIDDNLLYAENEKWVRCDKNKGYYIDLILENSNRIIEFNGDFYHANPLIYEKNSIIRMSKTKTPTAKEIWDNDAVKLNNLKKLGYDILIIWESEYLSNKEDIISKCINHIKKK